MIDTRVKYPNKLREIRRMRGLRQIDVTERLGLAGEDRLCRWERGTAVPHLINLMKLMEIYDVTVEEMYPELLEVYK